MPCTASKLVGESIVVVVVFECSLIHGVPERLPSRPRRTRLML